MIPLIYHPGYNITAFGLERRHPFDGRKYQRIRDELIRRGLRAPRDFIRPGRLSRVDLLRVHTSDYLRSLSRTRTLCQILELPGLERLPAWLLKWRVLRPMRCATAGTMLACRLALKHGIAVNLGGGYHHAGADFGGGFCCYADTPLALERLHDEGQIGSALVIDLDAHQGNGTATVLKEWPWARIADLYERDLFPYPKVDEHYAWPVGPGMAGPEYLDVVRNALPLVLDECRPDLIVYNAGSDPYQGDPLAHFRLTRGDLSERDLAVTTLAREREVPLALVLSGGYSAESWQIHADSIEGILARFDRG